ncbi:hypothetical protein RU08_06430 [Pseudomonas fulva]|uniref:Uncharacterized protein n=1 Tax=Pseudomonas fulva TaxID=47880 RepID=A0A0D0KXV3_9PSED|nr:hypothetical protein RU08_06430 [Pseudomonas fulva]
MKSLPEVQGLWLGGSHAGCLTFSWRVDTRPLVFFGEGAEVQPYSPCIKLWFNQALSVLKKN